MRTRRYASLLLAVLMALALSACGEPAQKEDETMSIAPAQLSQEETALTELLGLGMENYRIFDYQVGGGVQSIQLTVYELVGTEWEPKVNAIRSASTDPKGRIALAFGRMTEGVRVSFQSENSGGGATFTMETEDDVSSMACATSMLTNAAEIAFDQEVPLVVQIVTSKNQINSYDVSYFGMPREYAKHEYEHVYAITVTFSEKAVEELSSPAP
ncbi:MAG: hypothetical protein K2P49_02945 [Oscillospiraceae bacterium]|nr:hypothetical protein [Oscillospiraceae bacterium]